MICIQLRMLNDIVLHFDEKIDEHPGEITGFFLMVFALFFYGIGIVFAFTIGFQTTTFCFFGVGLGLQSFIPIGGLIEICISQKGTIEEGLKNSLKGAGSVFWCCCFH